MYDRLHLKGHEITAFGRKLRENGDMADLRKAHVAQEATQRYLEGRCGCTDISYMYIIVWKKVLSVRLPATQLTSMSVAKPYSYQKTFQSPCQREPRTTVGLRIHDPPSIATTRTETIQPKRPAQPFNQAS